MNRLRGEIKKITTEGNLSMVEIQYGSISLKTIIIEKLGSVPYLFPGNNVYLLFKETEVVIGKDPGLQISLQNRIACKITGIEKGKLLSKLSLSSGPDEIKSVISTHAVEQMDLNTGDPVIAMVKTNEIMLSE